MDNNGDLRRITASAFCNANIELENELVANFSVTAVSYGIPRFNIDIYGDKGEIHFDLQNKLSIFNNKNRGVEQIIHVDNVYEDERNNKVSIFSSSFRYFAPEIVNAILLNNNDLVSSATHFKDSLFTARVLDAIKLSANTGETVRFNKTVNDYV